MPRFRRIAPVTAVRGNVDTQPWALEFPETAVVTLAGHTICVLHDLGELHIDPVFSGLDVVIAGHSHRPSARTRDGVLYLNPGSAGRRRFKLPVTLATLELARDMIRPVNHKLVP